MRAKQKKKAKQTPLTDRLHAALKKHGPGTSDALARRVRVTARAASHGLSKLKLNGRAHFTTNKIGENVWRAGAARKRT